MRNHGIVLLAIAALAVAALAGCGGGDGDKVGAVVFYGAWDGTRPVIDPMTDLTDGIPFVFAPEGEDIAAIDLAAYTFTITSGSDLLEGGLADGWPANRFKCYYVGAATVEVARKSDGKTWTGALVVHPAS